VDDQDIPLGGQVTEPDAPALSGKAYGGWYTEAGSLWNFDLHTVNADITLYAKWNDPTTIFVVTFNSQGGSTVADQEVVAGGKVSEPEAPNWLGKVFAGWYKEAECLNPWDFGQDRVNEDTELFARWNEETFFRFEVTFNSQGGSSVDSQKIPVGGKVTWPGIPTFAGHVFEGWYREMECVTPWDFEQDTVESDITLYAKWVYEDDPGGVPDDDDDGNGDGGGGGGCDAGFGGAIGLGSLLALVTTRKKK
jgi:uncharacterized repeat protein (TIGR02543 family)